MKIRTQYEMLRDVYFRQTIRKVKHLRVFLYILANKYQELNSLLRYGTTDMFTDFDIETITTCNRRCSYCPNSIFERSLPKNERLMDKELFEKIVDELAEMKFSGRIRPYFYGEPLLDKRLPELLTYTRKRLPKARIMIASNGDFLTIELYEKLIAAGVNGFRITQHGQEMSKNMCLLFKYFRKHPSKKVFLAYQSSLLSEPLSNRGGIIKLEKVDYIPRCLSPTNPVVVTYKGDVVLCCNDYHSSVVFGNVQTESLVEIWNSERYKSIRHQLKKRVYKLPICRQCVGLDKV